MRAITVAVLITVAVACKGAGDSATGVSAAPPYVGTLALKSANFSGPPSTILQQGAYALVITDGQLTLNLDQTYQLRVNFRLTKDGVVTTPQWAAAGKYTVLMQFGQPNLSFVDNADSNLMSMFRNDPSGVSGAALLPSGVAVGPDGQSFQIIYSFSK